METQNNKTTTWDNKRRTNFMCLIKNSSVQSLSQTQVEDQNIFQSVFTFLKDYSSDEQGPSFKEKNSNKLEDPLRKHSVFFFLPLEQNALVKSQINLSQLLNLWLF